MIKNIILGVLLAPFLLLFIIYMALYLPFDYLRYKNSDYYKRYKLKYQAFAAVSYTFHLYNKMNTLNLDIDFYPISAAVGIFVKNGKAIISEYDFVYNEETKTFEAEYEDEYISIDELAKIELDNAKSALPDVLLNGITFIVKDEHFTEEEIELAKQNEYILLCNDENYEKVLKEAYEKK